MKYYAAYSPSESTYSMFCIGEENKLKIQDRIKARNSDEIIKELTEKEYELLIDELRVKSILIII